MIRLIARARGAAHVDVAIRSGDDPRGSLALCGNVCMRASDWQALKYAIETGAKELRRDRIEVVEPREEIPS